MRRILLLSVSTISPVSLAQAQTAPAPAPAEEEIIVRATPDQRTAIDRETYMVRDTAQARTSNALDLLRRIPAVTVQPDNTVRLLGTTGVTILVDGRPSPNPNILRDLQGSEIERIEVVSNPSAQFSASGTGGIINIVTRRNALNGLRGSVTASASRHDSYELRAAPSWTRGDWTVSGNLAWSRNVSDYGSTRERISLDPAASGSTETQESRNRFEFVNANAQVSYRPTEKRTITLQAGAFTANGRTRTDSELVSTANPGAPLAQRIAGDIDYRGYSGSLEYRAEGRRPGELLTSSIQQYRYDPTQLVSTDFGTGEFRFRSDGFIRARIFKLDYVRPLRAGRRLLLGGTASDTHELSRTEQAGDLPLGGNPFPADSGIDGSYREAAAYLSYQFPLLGGTLLAGFRVEGRDYDFADPALGDGPGDVHLFPSLHLERRLARWLTGNLSYSRRISWPAVQQLSPALRFQDATTASAGNPQLRPALTNAVEARLRAELARQTISLTLYNRQADGLVSSLSTLTDDGVLVTRPVNLGSRRDRGASLAVQGPIVRGLSYNLNANLTDRRAEREAFGVRRVRQSTGYSANAQLDYRDGTDGRRGADHLTASASYSGPYDDGLMRWSSFFSARASWSHALTDRLSAVATVDDIFGPSAFRSRTISDTALTRTVDIGEGPRFKLSLTYSLGRPGQPQPPTPAAPAVPLPGGQ